MKEVIKLPEFYQGLFKVLWPTQQGHNFSAMDFISRIDKCQISNDWNDITTWLCLCGEAEKWLALTARHLELTPAHLTFVEILHVKSSLMGKNLLVTVYL